MDIPKAIRLIALAAVVGEGEKDADYAIRKIMRWYSKTFHTPLHVVSTLPVEDVLESYYETSYEEMSEAQREVERKELLLSEADRRAAMRKEDADEAEAEAYAKEAAEEEARAPKKLKRVNPVPAKLAPEQVLVVPELPSELPPNIDMKFMDAESFDAEIEALDKRHQTRKR